MVRGGGERPMIRNFRCVLRIAAVSIWFFLPAVWAALFNRRRDAAAYRRAARWTSYWARVSARLCGIRVVAHGDPTALSGGLLVSNHLGYLDVVSHAALFPIRFAPKIELKRTPVLGWLVGQSLPIWVDRGSRLKSAEVEREIERSLALGQTTVVYPEGTTTDGEHGLLPFKSTPFEAAVKSGAAIQPLLTFYRSEPEGEGPLAWFGDISMYKHIWHTLGIRRIRADVYILPILRAEPGEERKELAVRVHALMEREYWRIRQNEQA